MTLSLKPSLLCSSFISELEGELKESTPLVREEKGTNSWLWGLALPLSSGFAYHI